MWVSTALVISINTVIFKRLTGKVHYLILAMGQLLGAIPFLAVIFLWYLPIRVEPLFWVGLIGTSVLNVFATMLAFKTLVMEDISFLAPIAALNPVVTTLISVFTLREYPSFTGSLGIIFIAIGASLLGKNSQELLHHSFVRLFRRKSVQYTIIAHFLWAITPTFEKIALLHSSPQSPALLSLGSSILISLGIIPFAHKATGNVVKPIIRYGPILLFVGFLGTLGSLAAYTAYLQTNLGYATAIFKLSMFFTIILASIFLKEKVNHARWGAAACMFAGVLLLAL